MYWFTSLKDAENLVFDELTFVVILPLVASLKLTEFTFPFSSKFKITFDKSSIGLLGTPLPNEPFWYWYVSTIVLHTASSAFSDESVDDNDSYILESWFFEMPFITVTLSLFMIAGISVCHHIRSGDGLSRKTLTSPIVSEANLLDASAHGPELPVPPVYAVALFEAVVRS